jgi:RHS repeat-associated protein
VAVSTGRGASGYGFTGEYQSADLVYLRARHYARGTGRFLTRDTWPGQANRPLSFNRWGYVEGNPVNFVDPTGLCTNCYVFFFPGAGNRGNMALDDFVERPELGENVLDNDLSALEKAFTRKLRDNGVVTTVVYPYGSGNGGDDVANAKNNILEVLASANQVSFVPMVKAYEILANMLYTYDLGCINNDQLNITFIGYSGGGQMAYSTAQSLSGSIFVDNVITFGSPTRTHSGIGNIGHLWSFFSDDDPARTIKWGWGLGENPPPSDRFTSCLLESPDESVSNDGGYWGDHGKYFDSDRKSRFIGAECSGDITKTKLDTDIRRLDAMVNLTMRIMRGEIKK